MTFQPVKSRLPLIQAIVFSVALHGIFAFWLDGLLVSPPATQEGKAPLLSTSLEFLKERESKNRALRQAFSEPLKHDSEQKSSSKTTLEQFAYALQSKLSVSTTETPHFSLQISLPFPVNQFTLPPIPSLASLMEVPRNISLPSIPEQSTIASAPIDLPIEIEKAPLPPVELQSFSMEVPSLSIEEITPTAQSLSSNASCLPPLPPFSQLEIVNRSDWFDTELLFLPVEEEEGAQFAVTIVPSEQLLAPKIPQNFLFLIDRSNSIQKERLFATKQALSRVLKELDETDRFNIVAFDSKVDKLFPVPMHPTKENLEEAIHFLSSIDLGSFFSPSDLYRPLLFSLPSNTLEDHLTHIVLMSDGEALSKKAVQQALLRDWTQRNRGTVSLYAIGLESDPHIQSIDALCALNRGKLLTAPTHRGIRKRLLKLIKMMEHPIAKEVSITAINKRTGKSIPLSTQTIPSLFLGQPAVFLGSMEKMDDFILFIQAKVNDQWVQVKKNLSFLDAKRGGRTLRMEIALQKAYEAYLQYSEDSDANHLAEARSILEPFDLLPAFQ